MSSHTHKVIHIAISDFKLVFRNPYLRIFLFMPLIVVLLINGLLPYLVDRFEVVTEYVRYVLMAATLQTSTMFGFIYCMVLIDEKDTGVNKVYGILPIVKSKLIIYRMLIPYVLATLYSFFILSIQPFYDIPIHFNLSVSLLTAFLGPIFILLITNFSSNKMQGMTWYKGINGLVNLPLLAFFIAEVYSPLFSWTPSHWIYQSIDHFLDNEPYRFDLAIGFVLSLVILALLIGQFSKRHFE